MGTTIRRREMAKLVAKLEGETLIGCWIREGWGNELLIVGDREAGEEFLELVEVYAEVNTTLHGTWRL